MTKRLTAVILAICMVMAFPYTALAKNTENIIVVDAATVSEEEQIVLCAEVDGINVTTKKIGNDTYLFLPSTADVTNMILHFESKIYDVAKVSLWGKYGKIEVEEVTDITAAAHKDGAGRYVVDAITEDGGQLPFYIMVGDNIPTLYLTSSDSDKDRTWVEKSKKNKTAAEMKMVSADGESIYDGNLTEIKARGNSTFTYAEKKSYQIKLKEKTDLLGIGEKVKTWILLANYADATLMHDKLFKDLAAEIGMNYVASCDWVNLYYDGEYLGVYLLTEKNAVNSTSVDIYDMESAYEDLNAGYGENMSVDEEVNKYGQKYLYTEELTEPSEITGGYLIERNLDFVDEANGFYTKQGAAFNIKTPEYIGEEAMTYISEYYQEFEDAVYATDENGNYTGYNGETGKYYFEYVDKTSLIQVFLIQELGLNPDGFISSFYLYKDIDGIMYAGPIWDQDLTLGSGWDIYISPRVEDYHYLAEALIEIPDFKEDVQEYFTAIFLPELQRLVAEDGVIDCYMSTLEENAAMNYKLWPYVRKGYPKAKGHLWSGDVNYTVVTDDMNDWLAKRISELKRKFEVDKFTRGMFVAQLVKEEGVEVAVMTAEDWKELAIRWAVENNITDGLRMYDAATREEIATMLWRYEGKPESDGTLKDFGDGDKVSTWAQEAMEWAVAEGIFQGYGDGTLRTQNTATANEVVKIIENYETKK